MQIGNSFSISYDHNVAREKSQSINEVVIKHMHTMGAFPTYLTAQQQSQKAFVSILIVLYICILVYFLHVINTGCPTPYTSHAVLV